MSNIIIGIVPDYRFSNEEKGYSEYSYYAVSENIIKAFSNKATIIIVPYERDGSEKYIEMMDALVFVKSSYPVDPFYYAEPKKGEYITDNKRSDFEFDLLKKAVNKNIPVLGIGKGMQIINIFFGGSMYQNIIEEVPGVINHQQEEKDLKLHMKYHDNVILPNTELARALGTDDLQVNSAHSQAIKKLGDGLKINSISKVDNIIEGIESDNEDSWIMGLQWLPEMLFSRENYENERELSIFDFFINKAIEIKDKK